MDKLKIKGKMLFDPPNVTNKHNKQSSWKKVSIITFNRDLSNYYAWFIKKRYNLELNTPLRGAHISFINDRVVDINNKWDIIKEEMDKKDIDVVISLDVRSNGKHWWLKVPHEDNYELLNIRNELGLGDPFFNLHMTIGYANERNEDHSKYIVDCINKGLIK